MTRLKIQKRLHNLISVWLRVNSTIVLLCVHNKLLLLWTRNLHLKVFFEQKKLLQTFLPGQTEFVKRDHCQRECVSHLRRQGWNKVGIKASGGWRTLMKMMINLFNKKQYLCISTPITWSQADRWGCWPVWVKVRVAARDWIWRGDGPAAGFLLRVRQDVRLQIRRLRKLLVAALDKQRYNQTYLSTTTW